MRMKKLLSLLLALVMVLSLVPTTVFATEATDNVYISVSYDGQYINDKNGAPMVYVPVSFAEIESIDLEEYNLGDYLYDPDGDGTYETTALQLIIYAHENIYGGSWSDVNFTGGAGSSYFEGGIFGFTENLNYFLNGEFPIDEALSAGSSFAVGATSDHIVLEAGDFIDIASFTSYAFLWDSNAGFHLFADENDGFVHNYTAEAGEAVEVKLLRSYSNMVDGSPVLAAESGYEISYGAAFGTANGTVTTDDSGCASLSFDTAGTYYLWCEGDYGIDADTENIVSSPAYATVTVTAAEVAVNSVTLNKNTAALKVGETVTLTATVAPDNATEKTVTWTSSKTDVASVADGVVTAVAAGEATITAKAGDKEATCTVTVTENPREAQDVSAVLNATMAKLASTVTAPAFGTTAGEWTVFGLARGGYYAKDNKYFTDYYERIVEYVNTEAAEINLGGALHKSKSTDNSRLIMALSSIGKDATAVGDWNLVEAYDANGLTWIKKQGINGTIWALIALDSNNYATTDTTLRQQCVDSILSLQHDDGGWSLMANTALTSDPDITGMALTALYPYRNQTAVAEACAEAFACLSELQHENGTFASGGAECVESCAWVIVSTTTWGINPDTDSRFIKNGKSVVDGLLSHYLSDSATFQHVVGGGSNAMATDQATYALVAYDRFINNKAALYDYSDVTFDTKSEVVAGKPKITLGLPEEVSNDVGKTFNAIISIDQWDNEGKWKLVDFIMTIPEGLTVTGVTAGDRLSGGSVSYHLDTDGKLRVVYFDSSTNKDLTVSGNGFPAEIFSVALEVTEDLPEDAETLTIAVTGMSIKLTADSTDSDSMIVVDTSAAGGVMDVVEGVSYSAVMLYEGDGIDLIPETKKAVAVAVTGLDESAAAPKLTFKYNSFQTEMLFNAEITAKTGVHTYVALVDLSVPMVEFTKDDNFTLVEDTAAASLTFGDSNNDAVINAQDALAAVDAWLRKSDAPEGKEILVLNVNGDSRINTFDALGIVEKFVNGSEYGVVIKAVPVAAAPASAANS